MATLERAAQEIEAAREEVASATREYRKGGSPAKLNRANDRLADAHCYYRECSGGIVSRN